MRIAERGHERVLGRTSASSPTGTHAERGAAALGRGPDAPQALRRGVDAGTRARSRARRRAGRRAWRGRSRAWPAAWSIATPTETVRPGLGAHAARGSRPRSPARCRACGARAAHVEERLVERDAAPPAACTSGGSHHLAARVAGSASKRGREEHAVGARAARLHHRHRRVHAEPARLVARRGDDAARAEAADDHRLPHERSGRRAARPTRRTRRGRRAGSPGRVARLGRVKVCARPRSSLAVDAEHVVACTTVRRSAPHRWSIQSASGSRTQRRARGEELVPRGRAARTSASTTMPSGSSTRTSPSNATARCTSQRITQPISGATARTS